MLNIGRMAPGSHDYYLSVVADGAEDYYLRRGEAPGRWLGRGLAAVDLAGRVEAEQLRRVLAGDHLHTGERLAAHPARKVPGFDLTFRAPKSVSLLWAFADRDVAGQVLAAHEAAVEAAVGYVEREAARTRRGAGGTERVDVDGLIAAAFPHRTSRAGDPLSHTHVLVTNLARTCDDGVWRTVESRRLFLHAKTAGFLYQAQLRHELTVRLGIGWEPVVNGHADIAGIDRRLIEAFSRRRQEILARLDERGESSAAAAQVATLTTRSGKEQQPSEVELRDRWAARAQQLGFDPATIGRTLGRHSPARPTSRA
jgi:conjugative relaxase-like TrwC/TraI family protein